jgi:hypothetical protein
MTTLSDYQIHYTKYRWEFLRRNQEYIKDWEKLQDILEEKYGVCNGPPDGRMSNEEGEFCLKWRVGNVLNPETSYNDWIKFSYRPDPPDKIDIDLAPGHGVLSAGLDLHRLMFSWLNPGFLLGLPIRIVDGWAYDHDGESIHQYVSDKIGETGILTVEIDLNFSKGRLIKEFKILLDEWKMLYGDAYKKKLYRDFCKKRDIHSFPIEKNLMKEFEKIYTKKIKERNKKYGKKYHFDNFDDYLKVYDLREEGVSWAKITTRLGLNSVQTARNHYKAACEIIERGVDLYVK